MSQAGSIRDDPGLPFEATAPTPSPPPPTSGECRVLRVVTLLLQSVVLFIPLNLQYSMGRRILNSIRTHGFIREAPWLLVIVGVPSAGVWHNDRSALKRGSASQATLHDCLGSTGVAVPPGASCMPALISGVRWRSAGRNQPAFRAGL